MIMIAALTQVVKTPAPKQPSSRVTTPSKNVMRELGIGFVHGLLRQVVYERARCW